MEKWVLLNAAEDLEPNLLSIVVTREKRKFLEQSFPEFSTVLQQKWEIFGKRLMTFWFFLVMAVFVLFQVYLNNLLNEIRDPLSASEHQHNVSYALYIIAGAFLLFDTLFEYSLGVVRSQEELDNAGFTCPEKQHRQYPIDLFVVDMPPWKLGTQLRKIYDGSIPSTADLTSSNDSSRSKEIKSALKAMSKIVSERHRYTDGDTDEIERQNVAAGTTSPLNAAGTTSPLNSSALFCNIKSDNEAKLPRGWRKDETKLFRQFIGYNYCSRSSLELCLGRDKDDTTLTSSALDIILENPPDRPQQSFSFRSFVKILRHFLSCFFGISDSRTLYSHLWSITMLLSGLFFHRYKNPDIGITFAAVATVFMFLYILRFYLLIETLGVYMVMIIRMLTHDLAKWIAVAVLYLVAFAEAFVLIGGVLQPDVKTERYFLAQFKWILGNDETDGFDSNPDLIAQNPLLHKAAFILFVVFMLLLPICLVNMLTGMFSKTCDDYAQQARAIHLHTTAAITLSLERVLYRLPIPILWLLGFRSSLQFVMDHSIARTLLGKKAPPPSTYIFRHHWAAFHSVCPFLPSRSTFVNCRTGYPLDASKLSFHAETPLHAYEVPLSFFCYDADSSVKELLRMNSPRAFYFIQTKLVPLIEEWFQTASTIDIQMEDLHLTSAPPSEEADKRSKTKEAFYPIKELLEKIQEKLLEEKFDRNVVDIVVKNLRSFSATRHRKFKRLFVQRMCSLIETEFVNSENYHLLTMDFSQRNELADGKTGGHTETEDVMQ